MPNEFTQQIIEEFRANGGRVGGPFEGARLLLLTTTGARSGAAHTTPIGYYPDGAERVLVIGSAGGAPKHPDWYHNLLANPGSRSGPASSPTRRTLLSWRGAERDRIFARAVEDDPGWADYQAKARRILPVVALHQVAGGPPNAASPHSNWSTTVSGGSWP